MKLIYILFFLVSQFLFSQSGKIIAIKDGDTFVILEENFVQNTLRLAEVDCPENSQPFGKNAKQFTANKIFGKYVKYENLGRDRYGRIIAKIFYDNGKYLSEELIKNGLGWWYFKYSKNQKLGALEYRAREKKIGLRKDKNPIEPWNWRKQKQALRFFLQNRKKGRFRKLVIKERVHFIRNLFYKREKYFFLLLSVSTLKSFINLSCKKGFSVYILY